MSLPEQKLQTSKSLQWTPTWALSRPDRSGAGIQYQHAIATSTFEPRADGQNPNIPAHGEDRSQCIKLLRPSSRGTSARTFNDRERPWDADQRALAAELERLGLQRFATNKFMQALEDREQPDIAGVDDLALGADVADAAVDVEVFGDAGRHARSAVSCPVLPLGAAVEVDGIFEIE